MPAPAVQIDSAACGRQTRAVRLTFCRRVDPMNASTVRRWSSATCARVLGGPTCPASAERKVLAWCRPAESRPPAWRAKELSSDTFAPLTCAGYGRHV